MRHRALGAGQIYVKQNTTDAQLTVQELRDMVSVGGKAFSRRVLHYATSLRGKYSYWFKQRSRLISMIDTLGLPTVFFTHRSADLQWPELVQLTCPDDPTNSTRRSQALRDNPAVADWLFYHRIQLFLRHFYVNVLGVIDYWFRFEWQHRGSPHIHGLAWLPDAPDVQRMLAPGASVADRQQVTRFIDSIVSTTNPGFLPDGSNAADALPPQTNPHVCNKRFVDVIDYEEDLRKLIATSQRHTTCSPAYCLRTKHGKQSCRFNYPKALQTHTDVEDVDGALEVLTARNDPLINSHNPVQLSVWRANVDMQYCVSRTKVINYCAKYATKSEPRSQPLKDVYKHIIKGLGDSDTSLKAVQKLLINSVGERDYSAQDTSHLLLQIPLFMASRDFVVLKS